MSGTPTGRPTCASSVFWMISNETTDTGKKLYALLLSAKLTDREILVVGKNTCTRWSNGEDVDEIRIPYEFG